MRPMRRIMTAVFMVSMFDAVATYVLTATGRGAEANPFLQFLNAAPEAVFLVQVLSALGLASSLKIFEILAAVFPTTLRAQVCKAASAVFAAAVAYRVAVAVNNVLGILLGAAPLADALYA